LEEEEEEEVEVSDIFVMVIMTRQYFPGRYLYFHEIKESSNMD